MLTPKQASTTKPGRYTDGAGLVLRVRDNGHRSWVLRVQREGKDKWITLKATGLEDARAEAAAIRGEIQAGRSPAAARIAANQTERTFGAVAKRWYDRHRTQLTSEAHATRLWARTETHTEDLWTSEVGKITPGDILACLRKLEQAHKYETARRTFQTIVAIMDFAVLEGLAAGNPAAPVKRVLLPARSVPRPALLAGEAIGPALVALGAVRHAPLRRALAFQWLTCARTGEVARAEWSEVDLTARTWTIPAERMKMRKAHIVPLSPPAVALLREAQKDRPHPRWVFPGRSREAPLTLEGFAQAYKRAKLGAVPHGVRAAFTSWAATENLNADVVEACQARLPPGVRSRYMRADFIEEKRAVLNKWAKYLDRCEGEARLR